MHVLLRSTVGGLLLLVPGPHSAGPEGSLPTLLSVCHGPTSAACCLSLSRELPTTLIHKAREMALRSRLLTFLCALPGAHFSCLLLELTQRDAEQVQAVLLGKRFPEGPDLGNALLRQHLGLHNVFLQYGGVCQLHCSLEEQHHAMPPEATSS